MVYPLCDMTVTLYRKTAGGIQREVVDGCFYSWKLTGRQGVPLDKREREFLLVIPTGRAEVHIGDRVLAGVGPKEVDWARFVPAAVEGLSQVAYIKPCYYGGKLCHTEAGGK